MNDRSEIGKAAQGLLDINQSRNDKRANRGKEISKGDDALQVVFALHFILRAEISKLDNRLHGFAEVHLVWHNIA
jgi:hypothetical protein